MEENQTKQEAVLIDLKEYMDSVSRSTKSSIESQTAKLGETLEAQFNKLNKMWEVKPGAVEEVKPAVASMKESLTSSFKDATSQIVPVLVGGGLAIGLTEVIDGIMIGKSNLWKGGAKAVIAVVVWKYGDKIPFMNKTAKNLCAGLIAFDAVRSAFPAFQAAISSGANAITKRVPIGGLGDQRNNAGGALAQANQILRTSSAQRMSGR